MDANGYWAVTPCRYVTVTIPAGYVAPEVNTITPAQGSVITGSAADIDIKFSREVFGVDASHLELSGTASVTDSNCK